MAKRLFDVIISLLGLVILCPLLAVIAIAIKLDSKGPVFYRGLRAGLFSKPFSMIKFRTMVIDADRTGGPSTSADDKRITRVGKWLRQFKLDEIPQLINVLRGEMSLIGPRPEVLSEIAKYSTEERELLTVRPGITDWASIRFNNEGEILRGSTDPHRDYLIKIRPEKMRLGLHYVRNRSFLVDLQILIQTVATLFRART